VMIGCLGAPPALDPAGDPLVEGDSRDEDLAVAWFKDRQFLAFDQLPNDVLTFVMANRSRLIKRDKILWIVIHGIRWCGEDKRESSAKFINRSERLLTVRILQTLFGTSK
jgi:hypothetical protein